MKYINNLRIFIIAAVAILSLSAACGASKSTETTADSATETESLTENLLFSGDNAFRLAERQLSFGPRVPGTKAHSECYEWLRDSLEATGAKLTVQNATLTTFDGTKIPMRNIFGQFNPEASDRILLLAHWDCRPWADQDPHPDNHTKPVAGANDAASGVAVLLELARVIGESSTTKGIDILFADAEDWGTEGDDDSWALGTRYFAQNPPVQDYSPSGAILLDMVGAPDATFMREYFSEKSNSSLADRIWAKGASLGYGKYFVNRLGSAVTDDHVELIKAGIPAIDIIDYRDGSGFFSAWHTVSDTMEAISPVTLEAVGHTLESLLMDHR